MYRRLPLLVSQRVSVVAVPLLALWCAQIACVWRIVVDLEGDSARHEIVSWITGSCCLPLPLPLFLPGCRRPTVRSVMRRLRRWRRCGTGQPCSRVSGGIVLGHDDDHDGWIRWVRLGRLGVSLSAPSLPCVCLSPCVDIAGDVVSGRSGVH